MVGKDFRLAVRSLLRQPGFAFVAIATCALGIGANTAIFSVINAVLLRPLTYAHADRIVRVRGLNTIARTPDNLSPMDFLDLHARNRRFERLAAFNDSADATLTGTAEPERVIGTRVTEDFFAVLGVRPIAGRDFRAADDVPGAAPVTILADGFWRRRFASDPAMVGRTVYLNSVPTEIIGVLPPTFRHPLADGARQPDLFVPFKIDRKENNRSGHYLQAIGLLKPGASVGDGEVDLVAVARDLEREYPNSNTGRSVLVVPILDAMVGAARTPLYILLATAVFVLLIACVNLANLLLARSTSRRKEIAIRQALGAGRARIVAQFVAESLVLATVGGGVGLLIAAWAVRLLTTLGANSIPRAYAVGVDAPVLVFAFGLSVVTGLVFGIGPALYAARSDDAQGALQQGGRCGETRVHQRAQQTLVVCEVALALTLLIAAGLLVKSLWRLVTVDPGFQADHVVTLQTSLPIARYPEGDEIPFYQRVEERLAAIPAVQRVGAINILPLSGNYSCDNFEIEGRPPAQPGQEPCAENRSITPGYFEAMGVPLLRGRAFTRADTERSQPVVIISDDMARRFWPRQDAIGAHLVRNKTSRVVIGIVASVKHFGLDRDAPFEMYTPHAQQPSYHTMTIALRSSVDAATLLPSVQRELWAIDRDIPISHVATMERIVAESTSEPRFRTDLIGTFAAVAVLLSVVGVAGVVAFSVSRRTQEIGIRMALGATNGRVTTMVLRQGLVPAGIGVAVGLAGARAVTRVLSGFLFGVTPTDPAVFATATLVLLLASIAATYLPARRAATVDPMIALRAN